MTQLDDIRRVTIETQARAEGMDLTRKKLEPVIERLTVENERLLGLDKVIQAQAAIIAERDEEIQRMRRSIDLCSGSCSYQQLTPQKEE